MSDLNLINLMATVDPWFHPGLAGGIVGGGIGVLGGIYGTTVGILAPRGKGRVFVMTMHWFSVTLGLALIVAGIVAVIRGQPYGVWFALLLPGLLLAVLMGTMTPLVRLRYRQAEHRRLQAEEFRRG